MHGYLGYLHTENKYSTILNEKQEVIREFDLFWNRRRFTLILISIKIEK
jgi:hypothetical protein